jgi:hypothetical protein
MATTCTSCGCSNIKCGCQDSFLTTPPPCPTPAACPDPEPCSEVTFAECTIYTGPDIMCGTDIVVPTDTNMARALQLVVDYFCYTSYAYSDVLVFDPVLDSMRYSCNGVTFDNVYGTTTSNITDFVAMLNADTEFTSFGQYYDNGDGRVRLEIPYSVIRNLCPGGVISIEAFYD